MTVIISPEIGNWYQPTDGELFKIVAFDNDDDTIEIQYLDEAIEEFDFDSWNYMEPELIDSANNLSYTLYDHDRETPHASLLELVDALD